ncbi:hypothetical protein ACFL5O_02480 [Myxococcota bacterium]
MKRATNTTEEILAAVGMAPAVGETLRLFQSELAGVAFPGLDCAVLEGAIGALGKKLEQVEQTRASLRTEEAELKASKEAVLRTCERALAYAKVYAADNQSLLGAVESISNPRPARASGASREGKGRGSRPASRVGAGENGGSEKLLLEGEAEA